MPNNSKIYNKNIFTYHPSNLHHLFNQKCPSTLTLITQLLKLLGHRPCHNYLKLIFTKTENKRLSSKKKHGCFQTFVNFWELRGILFWISNEVEKTSFDWYFNGKLFEMNHIIQLQRQKSQYKLINIFMRNRIHVEKILRSLYLIWDLND